MQVKSLKLIGTKIYFYEDKIVSQIDPKNWWRIKFPIVEETGGHTKRHVREGDQGGGEREG